MEDLKSNSLNALVGLCEVRRKRKGRGDGSGIGKTCGRGHKGQKARSGVSIRHFEGGQMPLARRLPKRGFNSIPVKSVEMSTAALQRFYNKGLISECDITLENLKISGIVKKTTKAIKLVYNGAVHDKFNIKISATARAREAIVAAGGKCK